MKSLILKSRACGGFLLFYLKELVASNLRVAYDVLTPADHMRPALLDVDVEGLSDRQLLAAASLVTMTPGSLVLDVSGDRRVMRVHAMYVKDPAAETAKLETDYIRRTRDVF